MSFIIPDVILETQTCSSCGKFLSVKPVKLYPNKQVKCGRCCKENDDGVVSYFGILAECALFKCVNRFDGCKKLVSYLNAGEHEKECEGKLVACPNCSDFTPRPTYSLPKHFKTEHKEDYLEKNWFFVNRQKSSISSKCFLYKQDDSLFFINFKYDDILRLIILNAVHLGEAHISKHIEQKFVLHFDDESKIQTKSEPCNSSDDAVDFSRAFDIDLGKIDLQKNITVEFELSNVYGVELIPLPWSEILKTQERSIKLKEDFMEYYVNEDGITLTKEDGNLKNTISLQCIVCGFLEWGIYYHTGMYYIEHDISHYVCYFCYQQYQNTNATFESAESVLPASVYKEIQFCCQWNCGISRGMPNILVHESSCHHQTNRICPVKFCLFYGKLSEISGHFRKAHSSASLHIFEPFFCINSTNASTQHCYILVSDKFVHVEYSWAGSRLRADMSMSESSIYHPVVRIYDMNTNYLGIFEGHFSSQYTPKLMIKLELKVIKCEEGINDLFELRSVKKALRRQLVRRAK